MIQLGTSISLKDLEGHDLEAVVVSMIDSDGDVVESDEDVVVVVVQAENGLFYNILREGIETRRTH